MTPYRFGDGIECVCLFYYGHRIHMHAPPAPAWFAALPRVGYPAYLGRGVLGPGLARGRPVAAGRSPAGNHPRVVLLGWTATPKEPT